MTGVDSDFMITWRKDLCPYENLWEAGQVQDIVYTDMADMETDIILPDMMFALPEYDVITGFFRSRVYWN